MIINLWSHTSLWHHCACSRYLVHLNGRVMWAIIIILHPPPSSSPVVTKLFAFYSSSNLGQLWPNFGTKTTITDSFFPVISHPCTTTVVSSASRKISTVTTGHFTTADGTTTDYTAIKSGQTRGITHPSHVCQPSCGSNNWYVILYSKYRVEIYMWG